MNPRLPLILVALVLFGGAILLWRNDQPADTRVQPISSQISSAISSQPVAIPAASSSAYDGDYVLAISWHPTFCEMKPYLAECRSERDTDYAAANFTLHGLWPQDDEYCGVGSRIIAIDEANRWNDLPRVDVTDATWRNLQRVMPGTKGQLERHEWVLHGSCSGATAETYFKRSIELVEEINGTAVGELMARNVGRKVSRNQIHAAFDTAFGDGAGRKVRVDCHSDDGRGLVYELRINLRGEATGGTSLRSLIRNARNAGAGCNGGLVDEIGEQ